MQCFHQKEVPSILPTIFTAVRFLLRISGVNSCPYLRKFHTRLLFRSHIWNKNTEHQSIFPYFITQALTAQGRLLRRWIKQVESFLDTKERPLSCLGWYVPTNLGTFWMCTVSLWLRIVSHCTQTEQCWVESVSLLHVVLEFTHLAETNKEKQKHLLKWHLFISPISCRTSSEEWVYYREENRESLCPIYNWPVIDEWAIMN